jgi:hypothetical protein
MKVQGSEGKIVKLKSLIQMHEKNYHAAIKSDVEFEKAKIIQQTIKDLQGKLLEEQEKNDTA